MKNLEVLKRNELKSFSFKESKAVIVSERLMSSYKKESVTLYRIDQDKTDLSEIDFVRTFNNGVDSCYSLHDNISSTGRIEIDELGSIYQKFSGWKTIIE